MGRLFFPRPEARTAFLPSSTHCTARLDPTPSAPPAIPVAQPHRGTALGPDTYKLVRTPNVNALIGFLERAANDFDHAATHDERSRIQKAAARRGPTVFEHVSSMTVHDATRTLESLFRLGCWSLVHKLKVALRSEVRRMFETPCPPDIATRFVIALAKPPRQGESLELMGTAIGNALKDGSLAKASMTQFSAILGAAARAKMRNRDLMRRLVQLTQSRLECTPFGALTLKELKNLSAFTARVGKPSLAGAMRPHILPTLRRHPFRLEKTYAGIVAAFPLYSAQGVSHRFLEGWIRQGIYPSIDPSPLHPMEVHDMLAGLANAALGKKHVLEPLRQCLLAHLGDCNIYDPLHTYITPWQAVRIRNLLEHFGHPVPEAIADIRARPPNRKNLAGGLHQEISERFREILVAGETLEERVYFPDLDRLVGWVLTRKDGARLAIELLTENRIGQWDPRLHVPPILASGLRRVLKTPEPQPSLVILWAQRYLSAGNEIPPAVQDTIVTFLNDRH